MKILLTLLGLLYLSPLYADEIDFICHCVNECVRETKCDSAFKKYVNLVRSGSNELPRIENEFLTHNKLSSLEFVDWGLSQCGTAYGVIDNQAFRYDFEFHGNNIVNSNLEKVSSLPTISQRKEAGSDELCLFKL